MSNLDNPTLNFPTSDTQEQLNLVVSKWGAVYLQEKLLEFRERLDAVRETNNRFSQHTESGGDPSAYDVLIKEIMAATQAYYSFISALPEDVRKLLTSLLENKIDPEDMGGLEGEYGADLHELRRLISSTPLLSVQSIRPRNYTIQMDAITGHLATLNREAHLRVGGKGSHPIQTTVTLDIPEHLRIEGGGALSTYDKSIINGVTTLIESGNTVFSIPMLYHAMTGKQNPTVDEQLYDELSGKLEKMRRLILSIDLTEENEAQFLRDENGELLKIEDVILEGYLLPLNKVSGMVNGRKTELYQIIQHPPLYTYSKMKRQLATVRIALLDAPINNNSTTIPLKTYLLQRIEMMKNKRNTIVSTSILYDSVYSELGLMEANKTRKARIRTYTTTILQHFMEQGYIQGFEEYKKGRSIAGVELEL